MVDLLVPVGPAVAADQLIAAVEVVRRTAPADVDAVLHLVLDPALADAAPATASACAGLSDPVHLVNGSLRDAAGPSGAGVVVIVDPVARPDLGGLGELVERLTRRDDPLPFVHRLGLLVTRRSSLAALAETEVTTPLPELARALRPRAAAPAPRPSLPAGCAAPARRAGKLTAVVVATADLPALDVGLSRLHEHLPAEAEVVIVDPGGDTDRSRALRTVRWATVVSGAGSHPASAGVRAATGDVVVVLEPSAWIVRHSVDNLLDALRRNPDAVAVGPRTNLGLGVQQAARVGYGDVAGMERFAEDCWRRDGRTVTEVDALAPGCIAFRRSALLDVGGLDEAFADPTLATLDLCLRLRAAGGRLLRADGAFVHLAELPRGAGTGRWRLGGGGELGALRARHGADADRALPGLLGSVMIVKNEEQTLARALESVSGVVDDVVVCDTGSSDGTPALIEACGARRTSFAWVDDFGAARNAALAAHTGTWGLLLDADETLECAEVGTFRHWLARNSSDVVFLVCRNLESGTGRSTVDNASARLLRAADCHWTGRIHEQMTRRDGAPSTNSASDAARILHDGYSARMVLDRHKVERNAGLTRLELDAAAAEPGKAHFERGRAEMLAGNKAAAQGHFRLAVEQLPTESALLRRMAECNLATLANEAGRHEEALVLARRAIDDEARYTQAAVALAVALLTLDGEANRAEAQRVLSATVLSGAGDDDTSIGHLMSGLRDEGLVYGGAAAMLGTLLLADGDSAGAAEVLLPLAAAKPSLFDAWDILQRALAEQGTGWAGRLAELAAPDPGALEGLVAGLDEEDRTQLLAALRERGIEEWQVSETERTWQSLQPELRRMSGAALVAAARQLETESPELALRLWRYAGDESYMRVGQARCLEAMGRLIQAADTLEGIDPAQLSPRDTLSVVAIAAQLGDAALAVELLDGLPQELDESLAAPARQMRELLTSA